MPFELWSRRITPVFCFRGTARNPYLTELRSLPRRFAEEQADDMVSQIEN